MPIYKNKDVECDGCCVCFINGSECYCNGSGDSVVKQSGEVLRIKKALQAEIDVLNLEKRGAY